MKNLLNAFLVISLTTVSLGTKSNGRFRTPSPTPGIYCIATPNTSPKPPSRLSTPDQNLTALGRTNIYDLTKNEPTEIPLVELTTRPDCPSLEKIQTNQSKLSSILPLIMSLPATTILDVIAYKIYEYYFFIVIIAATIRKPWITNNTYNLIDLTLFSFANTNPLTDPTKAPAHLKSNESQIQSHQRY